MEDINKKVVLIEAVEDDVPLRQALRDRLMRDGFEVVEASDGVEGLEKALQKKPDLILLDILMPRLDGIQMMKELRTKSEWGKNVPIILITNLNIDDAKLEAIAQYEPAYYLLKSQTGIGEIMEKIRERLSRT